MPEIEEPLSVMLARVADHEAALAAGYRRLAARTRGLARTGLEYAADAADFAAWRLGRAAGRDVAPPRAVAR